MSDDTKPKQGSTQKGLLNTVDFNSYLEQVGFPVTTGKTVRLPTGFTALNPEFRLPTKQLGMIDLKTAVPVPLYVHEVY